jgi:hypothetical protein
MVIVDFRCVGQGFDRNDVAIRAILDQRHNAGRHGLHDALVFFGIVVPVIDRGDAALLVVLDAVHGVTAEAERGHGRNLANLRQRRSVYPARRLIWS